MASFLLVHGSCHGAWCWEAVIPALAAHGHDARAIDLPSHGADRTPAGEVTLDSYADAILAALDGPTVLVGHSAGGFAITAAAERGDSRIRRLIYLCAYVPLPGKSLSDMRKMATTQPLLDAVRVAPDRVTFTIDPALAPAKFYGDLPPDRAEAAAARLGPQPILPQETALPGTARAEGLPRRYIVCREDGAVPPDFQRQMVAGWPGAHVAEMPTSHSPFLSDPEGLARHLDRMARD